MKIFITADDVARKLELPNRASFLAARHRLEIEHAFPPPVAVPLRPMKWRASAVDDWLARQGEAQNDTDQPAARNAMPHLIQLARTV